jgi:diaminopimelate epimerase
MTPLGPTFYKMTGSGNDFVFFDIRTEALAGLETVESVRALCARGTGVGADGVVFLDRSSDSDFAIRYYNADGSLASLCGNASLCSVALATRLNGATRELRFGTGAGTLSGRICDGEPQIDVGAVRELTSDYEIPLGPGEERIGFALVGVPHLTILCADVNQVDVEGRGSVLRRWPTLAHGANANFVSRLGDGWAVRTFERGVEAETLACGTGAVASAAILRSWGESADQCRLRTRSGKVLTVRLRGVGSETTATLSGEGRLVFMGVLPAIG